MDTMLLDDFTRPMIGLPLNHVWFGYGSAVFLEFGTLAASNRKRRDGSRGAPHGEYGVMIEWGWRLEGRRFVLCGAWSDEDAWQPAFNCLSGAKLEKAEATGQLPELVMTFSNGMRCLSFMLDKGHPSWAIFDRRSENLRTLISSKGRIQLEKPSKPFRSN